MAGETIKPPPRSILRLARSSSDRAETLFSLIDKFGGYGFNKSHSAAYALIAYQTMHLKRAHPAAFYCALFNQQPMGFYSVSTIVEDAKRHDVAVRPVDVTTLPYPGFPTDLQAQMM